MATPYELAYLSNLTYDELLPHKQMCHAIEIADSGKWEVYFDCGMGGGMYCTKFIEIDTKEEVIAFRGSRLSNLNHAIDWLNNLQHLHTRNSNYIDQAKNFVQANRSSKSIITGHSLGGFLAITMAFYYTSRVVAFNPPWVSGTFSKLLEFSKPLSLIGKLADRVIRVLDILDARTSHSFFESKIKVYYSTSDVVTIMTKDGILNFPNVRMMPIGAVGWHDLPPMVDHFRANHHRGQVDIKW